MTHALPPEAVQAELDRILASDTFRVAVRSRALLRFIVEETIHGRADRLKDYVLGSEALGRGDEFDPRTDPIARVEASRLRSRLDVYYATEGADDAVRISVPKGGYTPVFEERRVGTSAQEVSEQPQPTRPVARRRHSLIQAATAAFAIALVAATGGWLFGRNSRPAIPETQLDLATPPTTDSVSIAMSPVGRVLAYVASTDGAPRLWIRRLDEDAPRALAGTEYASLPFWAPDGRSIGFFADGGIKRIDLDTGLVRTISTAFVPAGAAWSRDGVILHPIVPDSALFRTSIDGGGLTPATELAAGQTGHRGPVFLPDGRHFLFYAVGEPAASGVHVGELGSLATRRLIEADAPAIFAPPNHVLYVRHSALFIQRLDPASMTLAGNPTRLAEGVSVDPLSGVAAVSASSDAIVYRTGDPAGKRQFVWMDRAGRELTRIGSPESAGASYASSSPDWRRLAVQRTASGNTDVLLMDAERGTSIRFTTDRGPDIAPHWSPRGDRIAYASLQHGAFQLFERAFDGEPRLLLDTPESKQVTDWSSDGRYLLFRTVTFAPAPDMDIWALPLEGDRTPFPVVRTPFEERDAQFSPDGSVIAYQSNESGQFEIYVKPFHGSGGAERISTNGGVHARWRADGRELFYLTLAGELVAVPIAIELDGPSVRAGTAVPLFHANVGPVQGIALPSYLPSPDGTRFLVDTVIDEAPSPLRVILNWKAMP